MRLAGWFLNSKPALIPELLQQVRQAFLFVGNLLGRWGQWSCWPGCRKAVVQHRIAPQAGLGCSGGGLLGLAKAAGLPDRHGCGRCHLGGRSWCLFNRIIGSIGIVILRTPAIDDFVQEGIVGNILGPACGEACGIRARQFMGRQQIKLDARWKGHTFSEGDRFTRTHGWHEFQQRCRSIGNSSLQNFLVALVGQPQ